MAQSRTVLVIGPTWSSDQERGTTPLAADQPVGRLQPDHAAEGRRTADRAARVRADRPEAEPGRDGGRPSRCWSRQVPYSGARGCGWVRSRDGPRRRRTPSCWSCRPGPRRAARRRRTTVASRSGTKSARMREPAVVRTPAVKSRSFREIGTPCSGPRYAPRAISASAACASARAASPVTVMKALRCGSRRSIRARTASVTATGETSRPAMRAETSLRERAHSSSALIAVPSVRHRAAPARHPGAPALRSAKLVEDRREFRREDGAALLPEGQLAEGR